MATVTQLESAVESAARVTKHQISQSLIDLIWCAGFMDGEGTIGLMRKGADRGRRPFIVCTNTDLSMLEFMLWKFGGIITLKKMYNPSHKQCYEWREQHDAALHIMSMLRPYMRCSLKTARIDLLLSEYKIHTKRNGKYTESEKVARLNFETRFLSIV